MRAPLAGDPRTTIKRVVQQIEPNTQQPIMFGPTENEGEVDVSQWGERD